MLAPLHQYIFWQPIIEQSRQLVLGVVLGFV